MNYDGYEVVLTDHAHERYVERVGPIERDELQKWCTKQFAEDYWFNQKHALIEFCGTWWGFRKDSDKCLVLTTSYGKGGFNMVQVIVWEKEHNDRINLKTMA